MELSDQIEMQQNPIKVQKPAYTLGSFQSATVKNFAWLDYYAPYKHDISQKSMQQATIVIKNIEQIIWKPSCPRKWEGNGLKGERLAF